MSEKKIVVPEGMMKAVQRRYPKAFGGYSRNATRLDLEAACRWLSENPIVPTWKQVEDACRSGCNESRRVLIEWQRMMFLAPEPEIPDQIKDLIREQTLPTGQWYTIGVDVHNQAILEAFRRGQKAGPQ